MGTLFPGELTNSVSPDLVSHAVSGNVRVVGAVVGAGVVVATGSGLGVVVAFLVVGVVASGVVVVSLVVVGVVVTALRYEAAPVAVAVCVHSVLA